tara:strand:+ start:1688 stop:1978 length:291 start_codon:yes stop_codon:yes gene_type:complete
MPASITASTDNVLPPYMSKTDPISTLSTGTYNASQYGEAWTDHPGSLLPSSSCGMNGGGKTKRRNKKRAYSKKKAAMSGKKRKTKATKKRRTIRKR